MVDRVILPKSDIVGTREWAARLIDAIKTDHSYAERDVSLFAEHAADAKVNQIWNVVFDDKKGNWDRFCTERLNLPADYVNAIIVGVGVLRGKGYNGPIPAAQAQRVAAIAEQPRDILTHEEIGKFGRLGGRGNSNPNDNSNEGLSQGNSSDYLTARIARDRPDILEDMKQGKYRSVRAAAIDAGIVKPQTRYSLPDDPTDAGRYLAQRVDREWFDALIDSYYKSITE